MIMAIDPGGTTGIAIDFQIEPVPYTLTTSTPEELWHIISDAMSQRHQNVVVLEQFSTGGRLSKDGHYTIELCGGVKAICHMLGAKLIKHMPQHRIAFLDRAREMLKEIHSDGYWTEHELDALAHLLMYQRTGE